MNLGETDCTKWYTGSDGVNESNIGYSGFVVRYLFNKAATYTSNITIVIDDYLRKTSWLE